MLLDSGRDIVIAMVSYDTVFLFFFFSSRRRHTRYWRDWSSDVCSSDLGGVGLQREVLTAGGLQQPPPGGDVGPLAQDCAALPLGQPAPDTPLDLVVQCLSQALGAHRAAGAQPLGVVLRRPPHEQLVGPALSALSQRCPVLVPRHDLSPCLTCSPKQVRRK